MAHGRTHFDILAPRSRFYHGPFGRLCPELPPWSPPGVKDQDIPDYLFGFADQHMIELPGQGPGQIASNSQTVQQLEQQFNSTIPAGYTYFGQFVDHDITFDPASSLMRRNDPNGLLNFRTPRLDLDNLYGSGPSDQPYLYDQSDSAKMAIGRIEGTELPDLPRYDCRALIGDMRNDENAMVSQLQLAFLLAHNTLVDRARDQGVPEGQVFERARRTLRWLYQHIVWNDFLRRVCEPEVFECALSLEAICGGRKRWVYGLEDVYNWKDQPFMPVEFAVAAYRFGHSMVRNSYQTNQPERGFGNFAPIFDNTASDTDPDDLRGFRPMQKRNSIQWDWFFSMTSSQGPFPQMARKIDTKLANALAFLHEEEAGNRRNVLAFRNLQRGWTFGLPSGTGLAKKYCLQPLALGSEEPDALWYYILREAEEGGSNHLGRLGSTIVCAVFSGLLKGDPSSWVVQEPCWTPDDDPLLKPGTDNVDDQKWSAASIIRLAGIKADGIGFEDGEQSPA